MSPDFQPILNRILDLLQRPFWTGAGFWISLLIGIGGLCSSILAFLAARQAKKAATSAGRTVKLQSLTIELTEISQKLDRIHPEIRFDEARDLFSEVSWRLRRVVSPFKNEAALSASCDAALQALDAAHGSLKSVHPTDPNKEKETPSAVYYAIEDDFAMIKNCVADLTGLFEKQTFNFGDKDAKS
jgi:hypothetical protein